jgi:YVTN family beta-propeller protein
VAVISYTSQVPSDPVRQQSLFERVDVAYERSLSGHSRQNQPLTCGLGLALGGVGSIISHNPLPFALGSALCIPSVAAQKTIPVEGIPYLVAITPDGEDALVTAYSIAEGNLVNVINLVNNTVIKTILLEQCCGIAITPNGMEALVSGPGSTDIINLRTNQVTATVNVSGGHVAIYPNGTKAVMAWGGVSVIDLLTNTITANIFLGGGGAQGVAITPDGSKAVVTTSQNPDPYYVFVIDLSANKVITTIPFVGTQNGDLGGVAITPDGSKALVVYDGVSGYDAVYVIDLSTNTINATVSIGDGGGCPSQIAITPDGSKALVTDFCDSDVAVIDLSTNKVTATLPAGLVPDGIAITPDGSKAVVVITATSNVYVIDL